MPRARFLSWTLAGLAAALVATPWASAPAWASDPFLDVPAAEIVDRSPAFRYANMGASAALEELDRRKILYQRVERHGEVRTPIRLTGKLHGVHIHSALPEHERPATPFEICDARFALALDDFSALLARHDIVEAIHYTMYRPGVADVQALGAPLEPTGRWSTDGYGSLAKKGPFAKGPPVLLGAEQAKRRKNRKKSSASTKRPKGPTGTTTNGSNTTQSQPQASTQSRHPLGLAIDIGVFVKRDGSLLSVASHFRGSIGARTCGSGASQPADPPAKELRAIVCEAYDAKIFTYVLTPNFDQPHQDHFHMDIKPGVRWFLYH